MSVPCPTCGGQPTANYECPPIPIRVMDWAVWCENCADGETAPSRGEDEAWARAEWDERAATALDEAWDGLTATQQSRIVHGWETPGTIADNAESLWESRPGLGRLSLSPIGRAVRALHCGSAE